MTKIAEWMQEEQLILGRVAIGIGAFNGAVVKRYRDGARIPDRQRMKALVVFSEGRVTPNDIYGLTELIAELQQQRARRLAGKKAREPHPELPFEEKAA